MSEFAAVLIAGGASLRMGQSKAFIDYAGMPLWRRQINTLAELAPSELLISTSAQLTWEPGPWQIIYDRMPGLGPLGGLDAAFHASSANFLVVLAVDMPAMTADFLKLLLSKVGEKGIVPKLADFFQGTAAVYPRSVHPLVENILANDDRSFQSLVRRAIKCDLVDIHPVTEEQRVFFLNINEPRDLPAVSRSTPTKTG